MITEDDYRQLIKEKKDYINKLDAIVKVVRKWNVGRYDEPYYADSCMEEIEKILKEINYEL